MSKSNLVIDESPIVFQPTLAKLIGLHEAIVLQTLKYWCGNKKSGRVVDDERWIFNTLEQWREFSFPFWCSRTIGEIFRTLEAMGLVKSKQFDLHAGKAMKYYTITDAALTILTREKVDHMEESFSSIKKNLPDHVEESARSARARLIKQYTEKHTEKQKPLTPSQGEVESSASASRSTGDLFDETANAANGADAQVGKADALSSRPPNSVNTRTPFRAPKSPPIDPEKFSEFRKRANLLLGRRDATNWSAGEIKAAKANLETCEEDWKLLEKYYANRGKDGFYTRRSMLTLLNNWAGEIDKSRAHYEKESENEYRCDDFKL